MVEYIQQQQQQQDENLLHCRREVLGRHLDGEEGMCCMTLAHAALCDVCISVVAAAAMVEEDDTPAPPGMEVYMSACASRMSQAKLDAFGNDIYRALLALKGSSIYPV
jgi:hypothetical protein